METNPYQAPRAADSPAQLGTAGNRTLFVLAAVGAGLAALYWGGLTALFALASTGGNVSAGRVFMPIVLVFFYANRAFRIFKNDAASAKAILWLHGLGGIMAGVQMLSGNAGWAILQAVKIAIHIFGGVTAYLAYRSTQQS